MDANPESYSVLIFLEKKITIETIIYYNGNKFNTFLRGALLCPGKEIHGTKQRDEDHSDKKRRI
jgi:hypothetical protein